MISAGIDIGSSATKAVILKDKQMLSKAITPSRADPNQAAGFVLKEALKKADLSEVDVVVSTGYGRRAIDFIDETVTDITAGAKGAVFLGCPFNDVRTVVDLGGQDTKVITLDENGYVANFVMNDKCAAGTGRFLEFMAGVLETKIEDLGNLSLKSRNPLKINSTCTVFAESEVVSLIVQKKKKEDIIAGLHESIAKRIAGMVREIGAEEPVFFCGGGAKNVGIKKALENNLAMNVYIPEEPQFVIALGAALIAKELLLSKSQRKE